MTMTGAERPVVLVVDDSRDMREVVHEILESAGYEVTEASSGARALEAMGQRRPNVVITDLLMPGMSGFALRAAMLRRPDLAAIPVIVLSGYWQRPGETLEAVDALPKPISVDRLVASVRRATNGTNATNGMNRIDGTDGANGHGEGSRPGGRLGSSVGRGLGTTKDERRVQAAEPERRR
jgi:CheY-like chemotaxis protein